MKKADSFDPGKWLIENKLTKESQTLKSIEFNGKQVPINSITIGNIDMKDYPDFSDASVEYAEYEDGTPLDSEELSDFTDENSDLVNELAHEQVF